jgi:hypothetical protein
MITGEFERAERVFRRYALEYEGWLHSYFDHMGDLCRMAQGSNAAGRESAAKTMRVITEACCPEKSPIERDVVGRAWDEIMYGDLHERARGRQD